MVCFQSYHFSSAFPSMCLVRCAARNIGSLRYEVPKKTHTTFMWLFLCRQSCVDVDCRRGRVLKDRSNVECHTMCQSMISEFADGEEDGGRAGTTIRVGTCDDHLPRDCC